MPIRWRWPPENWWGKLSAWSGLSPTRCIRSATAASRSALVPMPVDVERRADGVAHALSRVERGERVLEDDLHAPPVARKRAAVERADFHPGEARCRLRSPEPGPSAPGPWSTFRSRTRPRGPGFRPCAMRETDAVDSLDRSDLALEHAGTDREMHLQILEPSGAGRARQQPALATSQHAAKWPARLASNGGRSARHRATAFGHRGAKAQPGGRFHIGGTVPGMSTSRSPAACPPRIAGSHPSGRCV